MTLMNAQKIICDFGYENMDKLILESLHTSFNKEKHEFRAFSIFEGQLSLNKININEYKENPLIQFIYVPINKVVTIENFGEYDIRNIISNNIDMNKIVDIKDELAVRRMKKEVCGIKDMLIEYMMMNEDINTQIVSYIVENI